MNKNLGIGIVVVLALAVVGWWYWTQMQPTPAGTADQTQNPEDSVNGVAQPIDQTRTALAGTWKSDTDAKFVRTFGANGTFVDKYEGDDSATIAGSWSIVTDRSQEPASLPVVKDAKIIKVQLPEEVMYFALLSVTDTHLSLSYLGGAGGTLEFSKVQ